MKPNLSITIVAYRNYDQIRTAIKSIEEHTSKEIAKKIYISDNSEIESEAARRERADFVAFLDTYGDIEYIANQRNLGFGGGHNVVLDRIESDFHAIVNPDVQISEDVFSAILRYMERERDVGMVIPRIVDENGELQAAYRENPTVMDMLIRRAFKSIFRKRQERHTMQNMDYCKPFQVPFAQGCFLVIRTALFQNLGGFDERFFMYMEDADLCRRVNERSRVMYCPDASVMHTWEKGSHRDLKLLRIHIQSMLSYFNKWGWKLI